jgi:cation diffusion facilitator family transporter
MDGSRGSDAKHAAFSHSHVFLGENHAQAERQTWTVIGLCGAMMVLEIVGGLWFGSIALVADGLHMSTHAGALLLAALAYSFARKYAEDARFSFGTGKIGDLAGFSSAIVLAMIALLIGYEAISRLFAPVPIDFAEAIPIAILGLAVNVASVWLLASSHHHVHGHHPPHAPHDDAKKIRTPEGTFTLSVFEDGVPPVFRLRGLPADTPPTSVMIETLRPDGTRQTFAMHNQGRFFESTTPIPEPHAFTAQLHIGACAYAVSFTEHAHTHGAAHRDNNMRAAFVHVIADAAVSVLVIIGLLLARAFGWLWMDPLVGVIGACVIASWAFGLIRDTAAILLDMVPDPKVAAGVRELIEGQGDQLADLHLWRLGPGHMGAIVSIVTPRPCEPATYRADLAARFPTLSHLTVEVQKELV